MRCGICRRCGWDPTLLWLWCRLAATALNSPEPGNLHMPLVWPSKNQKKKKKKKKREKKKKMKRKRRRPVDTDTIQPLAWVPPCATGAAQEIAKTKTKEKNKIIWSSRCGSVEKKHSKYKRKKK